MDSLFRVMPPSRVWVVLLVVAVLAFAACASGAMSCAIAKPLGLSAALGAAFFSFFDAPSGEAEDEVAGA